MNEQKQKIGVLITLLGGTLWGVSGVCGQYLFHCKNATSDWLVPIRLTLAGLLILLYYLFQNKDLTFSVWKTPKDRITLLSYSVFGMMACQYSYFTAIEYSNAGTATVLQYISPILIMLVMCFHEKKLPGILDILTVILALSGVFLLATHGDLGQLVISPAALFWGLFSAVTVVFYNLIPRNMMNRFPTALLLGWAMLTGGILLFILRSPWRFHPVFDIQAFLCLSFIILFGTIISFSLYMLGVKYIGPKKASLYACIEPVSAALFSALFLQVPFLLIDIVGFALILSTIFLLTILGRS